ncbi:hypothetical protein [Sphingomonas sp. 1P08PE]|uniref:hypothetical protein n=1 Tax=Sphingomonas sp. 1P08PE TaxID=554122 RepID=UPI00399FE814
MIGRPLRFMAMTTGGWTAARLAVMWPTIDSVPALLRAIAPPVAAATAFYAEAPAPPAPPAVSPRPVAPIAILPPPVPPAPTAVFVPAPAPADVPPPVAPSASPPLLRPPFLGRTGDTSRWSASIWAVARTGQAEPRPGNQLGGSQAGVRVTWLLDRRRRLAVSARLSSPLAGRGQEVAAGLDWQPAPAPVHLIVERRIAIDGGRGGTAALVVAGLDPRPLPLGFSIEAYGQAGVVARDRVDGFADGAVRVSRPILRRGGLVLDLGIGGWAGAQRDAARVDIGPTIALTAPIADRRIRLTLDWRQRIAGGARPGSGPALTIGTDL